MNVAPLLRLHLRTAWPLVTATVLGISSMVIATTASMAEVYRTPEAREVYATTMGTSAANQAFNGRGAGLTEVGGIAAFESGVLVLVLVPLSALMLAVRLTRGEEDAGRLELVTARPVARRQPLFAAVALLLATAASLGATTGLGMWAAGAQARGSLFQGAALAGLSAVFAGLGLVAAQVASTARAARVLALLALAVLSGVRVLVDTLDGPPAWCSPLSWLAAARAFDTPTLWPHLALWGVAAGLGATASLLAARRDLGAGLLTERPGPARGRIRTTLQLLWRLNRTSTLGWTLAVVAVAALFGAVAPEMVSLVRTNPALAAAMGLDEALLTDSLLSMVGTILVLLATTAGLGMVTQAATEERQGRVGLLLAAHRATRTRWWLLTISGALLQTSTLGLLGVSVLGLVTQSTLSNGDPLRDALTAGATGLPGALVLVTTGGLLLAWHHRLVPLTYLWLGWAAVVGLLAETLQLPCWSRDLSPLHLGGTGPVQGAAICMLSALALVLTALGWWRFAQRDLAAG